MTPRVFKWVLFAALCIAPPVLFFLGMAGGFFPVAGIAAISLASISSDLTLTAVGLLHVALFGTFFYGVASGLSKLAGRLSAGLRLAIAIVLLVCLGWVTLQPWYGWGGYATSRYFPLRVILQRALSGQGA